MTWLFLVGGAVLVGAVALVAVGAAVDRLSGAAPPAVFEVDDAVDWVAERLPEEAAGQLSRDDVGRIVGWWLEFFDEVGLSTEHGQELGDEALDDGTDRVVAEMDGAIDHVVARGLDDEEPLDAVAVTVTVDLLNVYLAEMGAVSDAPGE